MKNYKLLALVLVLTLCFGLASIALGANETLMQGFYWETPKDPALWTEYATKAKELGDVGITMMWIPPAYKGMGGPNTVGYDPYDYYDLGEFNQCGDYRTKYGTKAQLDTAVSALRSNGVKVVADIVINHMMGGNQLETPQGGWTYTGKQVWLGFTYPARANKYSAFQWHWDHFNGVNYVQGVGDVSPTLLPGKQPDDVFGGRNWNNEYLMGADIDYDNVYVRNQMKSWGVWIANTLKLDGYRIDASKHISSSFMREWLDYTRAQTGKNLWAVGEAWIEDTNSLKSYLAEMQYKLNVLDFPLQAWYRSNQGAPDFSQLRYQGLVGSDQGAYAVTFADNHDTSRVNNPYGDKSIIQNKEFLYAYILTLDKGVPCVWYKDYYAYNMKPVLDPMIKARKNYAYGPAYFGPAGNYYYTYIRQGTASTNGLVLVMSRGAAWSGSIDAKKPNTSYTDITGNNPGVTITTNSSGVANFRTPAGKVSIWVPTGGGDTTKPTVSLTAPAAGTALTGTATVSANASDNVAVAKVEFYAGTTKIGEDITSPYSISWNTTTVGNGTYSITAKAIDTSNNEQTSGAVSVTVSNSGFAKTYNTMNVRGTNNSWSTTAMSLVGNYTWQVDATFGSTTTERFKFDVASDWAVNFGDTNKDGIAEQGGGDIAITQGAGTYRITFNDSTKAYSVVKQGGDITKPTVSLTAPAAGATLTGTATVSANATDNVGVTKVEFYYGSTLIATDTASPYSISWNTTTLANGSYSLTAKAYDAANNSATSTTVVVTVANTSTKIPVTFTINNATTTMGWNVYVAGNIAELGSWASANAAGPGTCPSYPTWTVKVDLPAGATIQFKAIKKDGSGNATWEGGANKTYTVPTSGSGSYTWTWTN